MLKLLKSISILIPSNLFVAVFCRCEESKMRLIEKVYFRTFRWFAGVGSTIIVGLHTLPHVFPQRTVEANYKISCEIGIPSSKYKDLLHDTCRRMELNPEKVDLFVTMGFSTVSAGTTLFPNKAVVGLPRNSIFNTVQDIETANIRFEGKLIDWESNLGKALKESLLFSEKEIKFLIGHELTHIKEFDFVYSAAHAFTCFYGFYKIGMVLPKLLSITSFGYQVGVNMAVWTVGAVCFYFSRRYLNHYFEFKADEKSGRISKEYCEGGIEYMRSRLKINRVLRKMHGEKGEEMFSKVGNNMEDMFSHPKRTDRLKNLKKLHNNTYGDSSCELKSG